MKNSEKNNKKIISEKNNKQDKTAASVEIKRKRGRPKKTENNNLSELKNKKNNNKKINNAESLENKGIAGNQKINKKSEKNKNNSVNNTDIISGSDNHVKHRGRPKGTKNTSIRYDHAIHTEPGENTKFLTHDIKLVSLPSVDVNNLDDVNERIKVYFQVCADDDIKPSIASLALAFNTSRFTLYDWITGRNEAIKNTECVLAIKNAYNLINSYYEHCMNNGKINPVAGIFLMKNNMGYKDNTEHIISVNQDNNVTDSDIYNRAALVD